MIRELRKRRRLTLAELAERTGLSVGHLSQVERGISTPTIRQLHNIAGAMGVTIGWFFHGGEAAAEADGGIVVRADRRRRMAMGDAGIVDELLVPHLNGALELLSCTLEPGSSSGTEPYTHEGEEAGLVLSGRMELIVDDRSYILGTGDSFAFKSMRPHRYRNCGTVPLTVIWAITPPSY
ncbi:MAG: cupin domain-containing protein [Proteobacteria bacterium]|nr:cupin domain-containing protein [Pseudomonadota bacterium]